MIRRTIALAPSRVSQSQSAGANEANAAPHGHASLIVVWHICLALLCSNIVTCFMFRL